MEAFEPVLEAERPDWVIVPGDVNSTLACSLVAAKAGTRVAHLEAGLRSRDWEMPEEINRVVTDRISDLLLAPSPDAIDNLRAEGVPEHRMALVGNVMADTLLTNLDRARARGTVERLGLRPRGYALLTLHRPSNVDEPAELASRLDVIGKIAAETPIVWPVHPRTRQILERVELPEHVTTIDPVGYLDSVALQDAARFVLTDSGGMQEETTVLGVPCVTLRTTTERPITLTHGTNQLAGTDPDAILAAVARILRGEIEPRRPELWDGRAAVRTVDALEMPTR